MRGPLLADETLTGRAWCRAHSDLVDEWLSDLLRRAAGSEVQGIALVAVGGYGRSELCPQSDIDVMLVHDRRPGVAEVADRVWYPIWDQGLHLGHSVCTVREALTLASDDLDTATALLAARHVAGDPTLTSQLAASALSQWRNRSKRALSDLAARVEERHRKAGEVAFRPEPDLKEGRGGLRDVHALWWGEAARHILLDEDTSAIETAYAALLDARVELQRVTGRPSNVLVLEEQPHVSKALGEPDAGALMARVAEAARTIAWTSDDCWRRLRSAVERPLGRIGSRARVLAPGVLEKSGEVVVALADDVPTDPLLILRAASAAAELDTVIERRSLERLAGVVPPLPEPWPVEARERFVALLRAGTSAVRVVEALDQRGVWSHVLPEWGPVRALPQPDPFHDFTVDRHLLETAAYAASRADRVARPDLLVTACLLHDIGKGYQGDHATAGADLARQIATRMGFPAEDVDTLVVLVRHHLLLRDAAARRDIDDPATIEMVAGVIGTSERLGLLTVLTEADAWATGSAAWDPWQIDLVRRLSGRVQRHLDGDDRVDGGRELFPTPEQLMGLATWGQHLEAHDGVLTVMTEDRPGVFSRVAGVLALHGLDVRSAAAHSTDSGRALAEFRVNDPFREETPWPRVLADLELALDGRLALQARISARARTYGRRTRTAGPQIASVSFDDDASALATVIDVQVDDGVGVLYRITRALAELDLDIRSARVQTLGDRVHDAFYVRDRTGKITDARMRGEIEKAILHSLAG